MYASFQRTTTCITSRKTRFINQISLGAIREGILGHKICRGCEKQQCMSAKIGLSRIYQRYTYE